MKRITKQIKGIADAHIMAKVKDEFDDTPITDLDDLKRNVLQGKTYRSLIDSIEVDYCEVTSMLLLRQFKHITDSYRSGVYKGFKDLFNRWYS